MERKAWEWKEEVREGGRGRKRGKEGKSHKEKLCVTGERLYF